MGRRFVVGALLAAAVCLGACELFRPDGGIVTVQLSPTSGIVGCQVILVGEGFGETQGEGAVTFDDVPASILSWSDRIVTAEVPVVPTPGGASTVARVVVEAGGEAVGRGEFTVVRGILFESERHGNRDIWMIDPDGTSLVQLTDDPETEAWPCWSHDGTRILFERGTEIWIVAADGSDPAQLAGDTIPAGVYAWSPDDERIAYQSGEMGVIRVMNGDGSGDVNVTPGSGFHAWPSWSPDGSRLAYHADTTVVVGDLASTVDDPDVFVVDADGFGRVRLTTSPGRDWLPAWSPDGWKILFLSDRDGPGEIFSMSPDGSGQTNLTRNPAFDGYPVWTESRWLPLRP